MVVISLVTDPNDTVTINGLMAEGNTTSSSVCSAPVEDGYAVSTGSVSAPTVQTLSGKIVDFIDANDPGGYDGKAQEVLERLRTWQRASLLVDISTDGPAYYDQIISSIKYTRGQILSNISVDISFQTVTTVKTKWEAGVKKNYIPSKNKVPDTRPKATVTGTKDVNFDAPVASSLSGLFGG